MTPIELLEENIKNIPFGATAYNLQYGCFIKKINSVEYYFYDQTGSWRVYSNQYDKSYNIPIIPFFIFDLISVCKIIIDPTTQLIFIKDEIERAGF